MDCNADGSNHLKALTCILPKNHQESFWYGMEYMGGSTNRAGKQATGLWGNWIQTDDMNWNG